MNKVRELGRFITSLPVSVVRRRSAYISLSPMFARQHHVWDRAHGRIFSISIRDDSDRMSLQQVYLSESLNLRWMARWAELFSLYQSIVASGRQPLIIDCGANIGLSARYLSETFPGARVIGVEPSSANIARARENCTYPNVEFIEAAISSEVGRASLDDVGLGHNAYRVSQDAGGPIAVISMQSLIEDCEARGYVPFIAKIDIEGHEAALFSNNTAWIDAFSLLIVELHDWMLPGKRNSAAFIRAMADRNRDFLLHGEHVISIANPVEAS